MRFETRVLLFGVAASVAASACGSILQSPDGGGTDAGPDSGGLACRNLNEADCRAHAGCAVGTCSLCGGTPMFAGCYDPARDQAPICAALSIACPAPCSILDQASCQQRTDCTARVCPNCNGGSDFIGCSTLTDAILPCPGVACPVPCTQVTTRDACEARSDCHSVFVDPHTCACAALGCCAQFSRCADGDKATCKAPTGLACGAATPYCESPYVVSYTATCFEGCVQQTDCAN
jgi:hypothetical protein